MFPCIKCELPEGEREKRDHLVAGPLSRQNLEVDPQGFSGLWKEVSGQIIWRRAYYSRQRNYSWEISRNERFRWTYKSLPHHPQMVFKHCPGSERREFSTSLVSPIPSPVRVKKKYLWEKGRQVWTPFPGSGQLTAADLNLRVGSSQNSEWSWEPWLLTCDQGSKYQINCVFGLKVTNGLFITWK